jgi:spore maturation protein CgeB
VSKPVDLHRLPLDEALDHAQLVLVHEWNPPSLVERIGRHKARGGRYVLLFHDTHHRSVTEPKSIAEYSLEHYDGVLAFGDVVRDRYVARGWSRRAWTWHEAADVRIFRPHPHLQRERDLVWIGNWGDDERGAELRSYLIDPVRDLRLSTTAYGVRYPAAAVSELNEAGIEYRGWVPNYDAPLVYAQHKMTVHIPRRPYVDALPGIPTIRVFEAMACGIPLVSALWRDVEGLFTPGEDYLWAGSPAEMREHLRDLSEDAGLRQAIADQGLATIWRRHTCAHRVDELMSIVATVHPGAREGALTK